MNRSLDIRVLCAAALPPPNGGVAFLAKALLDAGLGNGFRFIHLNTSKNTAREDFGRVTGLDIRMAIRNWGYICYLLLKERPHVLFLITTADTAIYRDALSILVARLIGCHVLLNLHGTGASAPAGVWAARPLHRFFVKAIVSRASRIVVPTDLDLRGLSDTYAVHVPSEVIRNTAIVPTLSSNHLDKDKKQLGPLSMVAIGRLCELKGAWDLLKALALVVKQEPAVRLTWIGLGAFPSDDEYARQLCASLEVSEYVLFAGHVCDEAKFRALQQADVFVLPTHSEGFPLALVEAMAMGLPVVTTSVGGIPEVVKDGVNGYLVQPQDIEALADRVLVLLRDPLKRYSMGQANAKLYWENLSAEKAVVRLHTLFSNISGCEIPVSGDAV